MEIFSARVACPCLHWEGLTCRALLAGSPSFSTSFPNNQLHQDKKAFICWDDYSSVGWGRWGESSDILTLRHTITDLENLEAQTRLKSPFPLRRDKSAQMRAHIPAHTQAHVCSHAYRCIRMLPHAHSRSHVFSHRP